MSILGKDIPSQRENSTLLKRMVQMVMLSFWLPNYMEYACKAWFYRKKKKIDHNIFWSIVGYQNKWKTLLKHGFKKKKKKKVDHNIFRSIFGRGYSIRISLHLVAFKKVCSKIPPLNCHSYQDKQDFLVEFSSP